MKVIVNICRFIVALVFIFSGFVKAIDPMGTQYKIEDYVKAAGLGDVLCNQWLTLGTSVLLSAVEFCIGVLLLFAIHRRLISKLAVAMMSVMTIITLWLWIANPISDCGCFGDAIHLTNGQTLLKNIVLLACALVIAWKPLCMMRFISKTNQWIVMNYTVLFILGSSIWSLYDLPMFDFRPYHIGANIPQGMEIPEGEKQPEFETTFIMEKDGVKKEFTLDNYPDSTWTFVDSKSIQVSEGYVPPIHDFSIVRSDDGEDITEQVLACEGYTFLLVSPHLEQASDTNFGEIDQLYEYAQEHDYPFYCLTASNESAIERWKEITGAEYEFCTTDEITLKTIIRSNPGLVLIKQGTVIRKWSHNSLPVVNTEETSLPLEKLAIGQMPEDSVPRKIAMILLWFALPLFMLTLADRLWAWTRWLKKK
ncbi:MAG: DUF417 family protein [Prevotella sp.]|nr:DUF417 family protein [Prevotella sp.]